MGLGVGGGGDGVGGGGGGGRRWMSVAVVGGCSGKVEGRGRGGDNDAAGLRKEEEVAAGRFVAECCGVMEVGCWTGPSTVPNAQCGQWGGPTRWRCQRRDSTAGCWERGGGGEGCFSS